ncbi:MAG: Re/Si-specific NAD(P)(+) transhydrogenase subunit alpha [Alphaproteobacteria bacterium]|nr:Re/Si-specific NAD(P)(+) transhydrogenase subunit alpha [Alphaproteobacteria bacterium]
MKIGIIKEKKTDENRVAITPDIVKKITNYGFTVLIENGAGEKSFYLDDDYKFAGAILEKNAETILKDIDIYLKVQLSSPEDSFNEISHLKLGCVLIGLLNPFNFDKKNLDLLASKYISTFAMELIPRITRAQSMDVLSSQSNLAGYRAVIEAAYEYKSTFPLFMTAAGTVKAAKIMVIGAGVAGLQAIATAKRLGGIVIATDVRAAAKEQVESLGAKFISIDQHQNNESSTGYAKEVDADYKKRQHDLLAEVIKDQDIVITTALIPGKPAPIMITQSMVATMKPGSIIVDLAALNGGNCELTKPGEIFIYNNIKIIGHTNIPSHLAKDASALYAKNLYNFLQLIMNKEQKTFIDLEDEIIKSTLLTHEGKIINPLLLS